MLSNILGIYLVFGLDIIHFTLGCQTELVSGSCPLVARCYIFSSGIKSMELYLYIGIFGAAGCLSRYLLSSRVYGSLGTGFPYGTFAVNVLGAFAIGVIMEMARRSEILSQNLRMGLTIGFLGGFTTFSTFSYETFRLLEDGEFLVASVNILASVLACLFFTWGGIILAKQI